MEDSLGYSAKYWQKISSVLQYSSPKEPDLLSMESQPGISQGTAYHKVPRYHISLKWHIKIPYMLKKIASKHLEHFYLWWLIFDYAYIGGENN